MKKLIALLLITSCGLDESGGGHYDCYRLLNGNHYAIAWSHDNFWSLTLTDRDGVACEVNGDPCRDTWEWDSENMPECERVAACWKNFQETGIKEGDC